MVTGIDCVICGRDKMMFEQENEYSGFYALHKRGAFIVFLGGMLHFFEMKSFDTLKWTFNLFLIFSSVVIIKKYIFP